MENMYCHTVEKGDFGGECNRKVCTNHPAEYYNHSTQKHYCEECAALINEHNRRDAMEMFGHELCTKASNAVTQSFLDRIQEDAILRAQLELPNSNYKPLPGIPVEVRTTPKIGRNEPCPCASGKKYKHCCLKD